MDENYKIACLWWCWLFSIPQVAAQVEHNVNPIPLCLHPSALSLQSPLNKTKYARTSLLATNMCVNSHSPFPALSECNWLYNAVFFYYDLSGLHGTLHPQGWICLLNKVGQEGKVVRRLQNW